MSASPQRDSQVAYYLLCRRQLTRRWLRAVRKQMHLRPVSRVAVAG
jgi:hypothetical protein